MDKILEAINFEFKGLRVYKIQILISLIILPFSYLFLIILNLASKGENISYFISGFIVASIIGSYISLLALRISNISTPEVLELYSTMPITIKNLIIAISITYFLLSLPQIAISIVLCIVKSSNVNIFLFILTNIFVNLFFIMSSIFLGLILKNYFLAQGILPMISWFLLIFSPVYYKVLNPKIVIKIWFYINPISACLNIIRYPIGFVNKTDFIISLIYILVLTLIFTLNFLLKLKNIYMIEKRFI